MIRLNREKIRIDDIGPRSQGIGTLKYENNKPPSTAMSNAYKNEVTLLFLLKSAPSFKKIKRN
jgi:hypothetical protein